jgi:hypothetical protein
MNENPARRAHPFALVPVAFSVNGCAAIGGIFKAGVWVGVLSVLVVLALLVWGIRSASR